MFIMTSDIRIGNFRVKPSAVKWRSSVLAYVDTCTIVLPRILYEKNELVKEPTDIAEKIDSSGKILTKEKNRNKILFKEGDPVKVMLGYDGQNKERFRGFIKQVNVTERLELECEGYSYQLPKVFNKSYSRATLREILTDLTAGTDIKISKYVQDTYIGVARLVNFSGYRVLEWLNKECHITIYFDFDTIYAGTRYGLPKKTEILKLGWNTVSEKDFKKRRTSDSVQIRVVSKEPDGSVKRVKSDIQKYSLVKDIKIKSGLDIEFIRDIVNDMQHQLDYSGYEGSIVCFLVPVFHKSSVAEIRDDRFPERTGLFFVETVEGSFDENGGRQIITIGYFGFAGRIATSNNNLSK